jgi:hypothetical protein
MLNNESMTWDEREDRVLQTYAARLKDEILAIFGIKLMNKDETKDDARLHDKHLERILKKLQDIMTYRFYVSSLWCSANVPIAKPFFLVFVALTMVYEG